MTDDEALSMISGLAFLSKEMSAQRRRADALQAWQDAVAGALQPFLDGQPEVRVGAPVAQVVGEYLTRLVRERDEARAALANARADFRPVTPWAAAGEQT